MKMREDFSKFSVGELKIIFGRGVFIYVMVVKESKTLQNFRPSEKDQAETGC